MKHFATIYRLLFLSSQELNEFQHVKDSSLLVDCVCSNMINRMRDELDIFRKFTTIQLQTILEWMLDLGVKNSGLNPYDYKECVGWLSLLIEEGEKISQKRNNIRAMDALIVLCFVSSFVVSHAETVEIPTTGINIDKQVHDKEKLAIKKIAFQFAAFLLRAVGESEYPSEILNDCNHKFIIEQNVQFYKEKDFSNEPEVIKKYFYECFLISSLILKNNSDERLMELNGKMKELKNNLNKYLSQYDMEWDNIIFEATGKTGSDMMNPIVKKVYSKYKLKKMNMDDPVIMEKVIKESYIGLADFFDAESLKLTGKE